MAVRRGEGGGEGPPLGFQIRPTAAGAGEGPKTPPPPAQAALLPGDVALYYTELPGWREHQGEHVLIYDGRVHGFYPDRAAARREGFRLFGAVAFLVKQVDLDEKPRPLVGVVL
jgi:hypothetical protein